jgi:hypothetical protein
MESIADFLNEQQIKLFISSQKNKGKLFFIGNYKIIYDCFNIYVYNLTNNNPIKYWHMPRTTNPENNTPIINVVQQNNENNVLLTFSRRSVNQQNTNNDNIEDEIWSVLQSIKKCPNCEEFMISFINNDCCTLCASELCMKVPDDNCCICLDELKNKSCFKMNCGGNHYVHNSCQIQIPSEFDPDELYYYKVCPLCKQRYENDRTYYYN